MMLQKYKWVLLLLASCFPFGVQKALAVPAKPQPIIVTQADGTKLTIKLHGDEHFHYKTSLDGYIIQEDTNGNYYYVDVNNENRLVSSTIRVHEIEKRNIEEKNFLQNLEKDKIVEALDLKARAVIRGSTRSVPGLRLGNFPSEGEQKSLAILVEFADRSFTVENPQQAFYNLLNQPGYSENGSNGSARDYFIENSNGKFLPYFDVYGPVKLSKSIWAYGGNDQYGNDIAPREMVMEACKILSDNNLIDFSEYDNDNDGKVDNIYIFYAGYSESDGGGIETVWPHSWNIADFEIVYDGVLLATYACSGELINGQGNTMSSIGTFCHEFMHVLGLPDLYETNRNSKRCFTPGEWSILDKGPYNNDQRTPPHMSVYERYALGWLNPVELDSPANISLPPIDQNKGYIIKTNNPNEYYMLENRQQTRWDEYIPGHGMLVWHIDYDAEIWNSNQVNNDPAHQRVDLIEADGMQSIGSRNGDSFPGISNVRSFTDDTSPSMKTWAGELLGKPLTEITESDMNIYFRFMGGKDLTGIVDVLSATEVTQTGFIANWEAKEGATGYIIDVYVKSGSSLEYVYGYEGRETGNTITCLVEDLEPGTTYQYRVRAKDAFSITDDSEEISATTLAPTFGFYNPVANEPSDITDKSFEATWNKLNEATSYIIDVYKKIRKGEPNNETVDFTGKIGGMPTGWTTTCTSTVSTAGYYGKSAPALRFDVNEQKLESPAFDGRLSSLSFWYRGNNSASDNSIAVYGHDGRKWQHIRTVQPLTNQQGGETISFDEDELEKFNAVSVRFNKYGNGTVALDDVVLGYGDGRILEYVDGYESLNVGDKLLYTASGLEEEQTYYYTITGSNGDILSRTSNEVKVTTKDENYESIPDNDLPSEIKISGDYIRVKVFDVASHDLKIFNLMGQHMGSWQFVSEIAISRNQFPEGVHIIKIDNKIYKLNF